MEQVIYSRCLICGNVYGCYSSDRTIKKMDCDDCHDICPNPTQPDSHGYCPKHFREAMDNLRKKHLGG